MSKVHYSKISDVVTIENSLFRDQRGSFNPLWDEQWSLETGVEFRPGNANHSFSRYANTLRGIHFQKSPYAQSKLVTCVSGIVLDVVVDIRPDSPTFGDWCANRLSSKNGNSLFIPAGCAHGFITLEDNSSLIYLIEGEYHPEYSGTFHWADPVVGIEWPTSDPILSEKDNNSPAFSICEF